MKVPALVGVIALHACGAFGLVQSSAAAVANEEAIKAAVLTTLQTGMDAAARLDPQCFAMFSPSADVRFATEGTAPTLAEFRAEWTRAVQRVSRQHFADVETAIQVLSPDVAVSTTRANYFNVDANGATSATVPFALTAVWQRQNNQWRIVNAHESAMGGWPATTMPSSDPWIGTWQLNPAKSRFSPGPGPRQETRTYISTGEGEKTYIDIIEADGTSRVVETAYKYDGRDHRITGNPESDAQALTRKGPSAVAAVIKKNGAVVRTARRTVSADGNSLTVAFKGTNAKGQAVDDVLVFDKRTDPWLGSWVLNHAQSRIAPSAKPAFDLRTFVGTARGEKATYISIEPDGRPVHSGCTYAYDGSDRPVVGGDAGDTLAFTRVNPSTLAFTSKTNGKITSRGTRAVSADGKVLTVTVKHADAAAPRADDVWVFDRCDASTGPDAVATAVKAAVATHWAAINGGNMDMIKNQHTMDVTLVGAEFDRRFALFSPQGMAILRQYEGAKAKWTIRDLEVQPFGNTATATFYMEGTLRWANGTVDSRPRRVTETWVNDGGTWKEAHHHDSVYTAMAKQAASQ